MIKTEVSKTRVPYQHIEVSRWLTRQTGCVILDTGNMITE